MYQAKIKEILEKLMSSNGLNPTRLAAASGIPQPTIQRIIKGRHNTVNLETASALAQYFKITVSQLIGEIPLDVSEMQGLSVAQNYAHYAHPEKLDSDYILVPRCEVRAGMGTGQIIHSEQIINHLAFRADWVKTELGLNPKNLVLISAVGDSMEPTLRPGDLLLLDLSANQIKHDAIYVINLDGELLAKRVQRLVDGTVIVTSDNAFYREQTIAPDKLDTLRVIGRVVWVCRKI